MLLLSLVLAKIFLILTMHESMTVIELVRRHGEHLASEPSNEETSRDRDAPNEDNTEELVAALCGESAVFQVGELSCNVNTTTESIFIAENTKSGNDGSDCAGDTVEVVNTAGVVEAHLALKRRVDLEIADS